MSNLKAGTLKAFAVLAPRRSSHLPDVPTSAEAGLPGFESGLNYGLLAPAGTPRPIIDRLNKALRGLVDTSEVKDRISADGGDPMPSTPEEYAKDIEREDAKWGVLIRKLGLKVE
jgi:tripartite-type tricarboxylate transporter receptor subunit TctC